MENSSQSLVPDRAPRIGLFGGSFDPIHMGHLLAASEVADQLELDSVQFVTTARPPHKRPHAPAETRHEMVVLATSTDSRFFASRLELDHAGPSFTVDTLRHAQQHHPGAVLFFITGADAYHDLGAWKEPEALVQLARIVAVSRPGSNLARLDPFFRERITPLEIPGYEISSTEIRKRVREHRSVRYLVTRGVEVYIEKHRLYCEHA